MPCYFQMFDKDKKPILAGDSQFKDHIGWVEVSSWTTVRGSPEAPINSITLSLFDDPAVSSLLSGGAATARIAKAVTAKLDCTRRIRGEDVVVVNMEFARPQITQFSRPSTALPEAVATVTLSYTGFSVGYRADSQASNIRQAMPRGGMFPTTWPADDLVASPAVA